MKKIIRFKLIGLVILINLMNACETKNNQPNVVIILADDLGYGDPQVYNQNSKISTPYIDQLAEVGMRFTDAHTSSSVCTPTRYGILTGRYAWRTELKKSVLWMWDKPLIDSSRMTLPKMLKTNNYNTACIGKWHLGWRWPSINGGTYMNDTIEIGNQELKNRNELWKYIDFSKPLGGGPLEAGFDYYFGDDVPNFAPYAFIENNRLTKSPNLIKPKEMYGGPGPMAQGWKLEEVMPEITKRSVAYIKEQASTENPFFLYFSLTAPHTPIAPSKKFKGSSKAGLYGDFVKEVDWSVGEIIKALKGSGQFENTILIFTSDNGSPQRDGKNMSGEIGSVKRFGHNPSGALKGMKADIWEGGHRVPFIVVWPDKIEKNSSNDALLCTTDIIRSIASIINIDVEDGQMEDSMDFSSTLFDNVNDKKLRSDAVHHSIDGTFAIRKDEWKLILGKDSGGFSKHISIEGIPVETKGQLYNLSEDLSESKNLYDQYPLKVKELTNILEQIKESSN